MAFIIFIIVMDILVPFTMIIGGYYMDKHTPEKINGTVGYRTEMSMKNQDTWQFAHHHCGKIWVKQGFIMLAVTIVVNIVLFALDRVLIGIAGAVLIIIQTIWLVLAVMPTERALWNTFDEDGNRIK